MKAIKNAAHTPGPWHVYQSVFGPVIDTEDNIHIATLHHKCVGPHQLDPDSDNWPNAANARLIAAAPDMLALLERLVLLCPSDEGLGGHAPIQAFINLGREASKLITKVKT